MPSLYGLYVYLFLTSVGLLTSVEKRDKPPGNLNRRLKNEEAESATIKAQVETQARIHGRVMSDLRSPSPRKPMILQVLRFLAGFGAVVYASVLLVLALKQRSLMYFPTRGPQSEYLQRAVQQKVQPWHGAKGTLIGWKREGQEQKRAAHRMLLLHGNGGDALSRTYLMDALSYNASESQGISEKAARPDIDFYSLEYPGYGCRGGNANQNEIVAAALAALNELLKQDKRPLYIAGESLGSGVACLLSAQHPKEVRGLLLITPYTSIADVAASQFSMFPVRLVLQDKYEAAHALKSYSGPVAVLLAEKDEMVPPQFGQSLFDGYKGPKKLWVEPGAGHNSLDYTPRIHRWREISGFLLQHRE